LDPQRYKPPRTIERFLLSNARRRVVMGPFGSGKSSGCCIEVPRRAQMQRPGPDGIRRTRFAIVRNTVPQLRDTTLKTWFDWFPNGTAGYWRETGKTYTLKFGDVESEVIFRALDDENDVKNLLSLELTGAYMNECRELPQAIVDGLDGRIGRYPSTRNGGCTWMGMWADTNPPEEDEFWYYVISGMDPEKKVKVQDNGWESFIQPSGLDPDAENVENLPVGYYENMIKGKTAEYIKVYVKGQFGRSKAGKPVHPTFNEDIHVAKDHLIPNQRQILVVSADFGLTPAMVLKQQNPHGQVLTFDEIVTQGMGLDRCIKEKLKPLLRNKYDGFDVRVTGDPAGNQGSQNDEKSCVDIFKKNGFRRVKFARSNNPVHRWGATDHFLSRITENGPAFLLDPRCSYYRRGLRSGYHFKVNTKGVVSESVEKNIFSHVTESGHYGDMYFQDGFDTQARDKEDAALIAAQQHNGSVYHTPR